jgi:hypothetical protein
MAAGGAMKAPRQVDFSVVQGQGDLGAGINMRSAVRNRHDVIVAVGGCRANARDLA